MKNIPIESIVATLEMWVGSQSHPIMGVECSSCNSSYSSFFSRSKMNKELF